jgi:hypothetical protein
VSPDIEGNGERPPDEIPARPVSLNTVADLVAFLGNAGVARSLKPSFLRTARA